MAGTKVGNVDIQFGPDYDQAKANQLVQSLQQIGRAVATLANPTTTAVTPTIPVHALADQTGLGVDHTVAGLQAGQVLVAQSPTTAHFGFLTFAQLAQTDPNTFAAAANGDIIAFVNGYWSAIPNTLGLSNPGSDAIILWDATANGGAGGLSWALPGTGIHLQSGGISVNDAQLTHGHLLGLLNNDHPQYALASMVPLLGAANIFTALQTFNAGLTSTGDLTLVGNLEQSGAEPELRLRNTDDIANEGAWRVHAEPGQLMFASVNDDGSDGENWLSVQRVAELVDTIALEATYLTFNGFDVALAANVPALSAVNSFTAAQSFARGLTALADIALVGNLEQAGAQPEDRLQNTDDIAGEGTWRLHAEAGQEMFTAVNDDGSDAETWLAVQRIADIVDTVSIEANYLTFNGFDVCCGEIVPGAGAMPTAVKGYLTVTVGQQTIKVPYLSS